MKNYICKPVEPADKLIAQALFGGTSEAAQKRAAFERARYEQAINDGETDLEKIDLDLLNRFAKGDRGITLEEVQTEIKKLVKLGAKERAAIKDEVALNKGSNYTKAYKKLKKVLTAEQRLNRVLMIAERFSQYVDSIQQRTGLSREAITNGYLNEKNKFVFGQMAIFERIRQDLLADLGNLVCLIDNATKDEPNLSEWKYKRDALYDVLNNWGALVLYARIRLKDTEGIVLGNKLRYATVATSDMFADTEEFDATYDPEEIAPKEGWMRENDKQSSYESLGLTIRRFLARLPLVESIGEGQYAVVKDDLGQIKYMDPQKAHNLLKEVVRGATNSSEMLNKLLSCNIASLQPVINCLLEEASHIEGYTSNSGANYPLMTELFVNLRKNFQPYSIIFPDEKRSRGKMKFWKTRLLNRIKNAFKDSYFYAIYTGTTKTPGSIFVDGSPGIDPGNLFSFITEIKSDFIDTYWNRATSEQKVAALKRLFSALGIEIEPDDIVRLVNDPSGKRLAAIQKAFIDLYNYGLKKFENKDYILSTYDENAPAKFEHSFTSKFTFHIKSVKDFLNFSTSKTGSTPIRENITKIVNTVGELLGDVTHESRVRHKDSKGNEITRFSDVDPCYMGDEIERIQSFIKNNDKKGLKEYLEQKYLNNKFFLGDKDGIPKIYNRWIRDLYDAALSDDQYKLIDFPVCSIDFKRFLGTKEVPFENFTSKQHVIDMFAEYASSEEISNGANTKEALYPVFVLGDSGVSKYIRAPRYSEEEIIDGFYDVFLQELERQDLVSTINDHLEKGGYKKIKHFSETGTQFTQLTFLNNLSEEEKRNLRFKSESEIKALIRDHLDTKVAEFTKSLIKLGVLEQGGRRSEYLNVEQFIKMQQKRMASARLQPGEKLTADKINEISRTDALESFIRDFYLNYKFATTMQLQMMTIDPSFYNDTTDLQKRYKEIHAPGTILDTEARDENGERIGKDYQTALYFDDIKLITGEFGEEFDAAIKNTFGETSEVHKEYLRGSSLTDGQGYRSLTSYRMIMRMAGKWTKVHENAYQAIMQIRANYTDKGLAVPEAELKKIAAYSVVFMPLKPYLFTHEYVGDAANKNGIPVPVQHKYAEAILIPELLPKGRLRDMALYMERNNIDLICSTECVKVGGFGSVDIKGTQSDAELQAALQKAYPHKLKLSDFRIQTNVPEHIRASQLFGTQIRKLIMSGVIKYEKDASGNWILKEDDHYKDYFGGVQVNLGGSKGKVNLNGRNLVAFYNALVASNMIESYEDFSRIIDNPEQLSDTFIQGIVSQSREILDHILSYSVDEETKEFLIPLFEGGLEYDSMAFLLSFFRKMVNKQYINGGSAVQVSAMGIEGYTEDGGLGFICVDEDGNEIRSTDPDFEEKKDKIVNILYAECEVPWDLTYTDVDGVEREIDYYKYCFSGKEAENASVPEGTLKTDDNGVLLIEKDFPGILDRVAYRIPTERDYSMLNLKIVRFSHRTAGGTIRVPFQGTTIAGFDFDIDKLYFMMKEFVEESYDKDTKTRKWKEYDPEKSPLENDRVCRNNMILNLISKRLMDRETMDERYTPGGFLGLEHDAKFFMELQEGDVPKSIDEEEIDAGIRNKTRGERPYLDPTDPLTAVIYNQQNQIADKLIGIFANQNVNYAFTTLMKTFKLKEGIKFAGKNLNDLIHGPEGVDVARNMAQLLAASVDAVKNPILSYLNINTATAASAALLARLGYSTREIGALLNQPIIKEVCEYMFNNEVSLDVAIREVSKSRLGDSAAKMYVSDRSKLVGPDLQTLLDSIVASRDPHYWDKSNNKNNQAVVLQLFGQIVEAADTVTKFVGVTKFTAANSVGSTAGHLYEQQAKVQNFIEFLASKDCPLEMELHDINGGLRTPIDTNMSLLDMSPEEYLDHIVDNPFGYEQTMFDLNRKALKALMKYYPYDTEMYQAVRRRLRSLTKSRNINEDIIDKAHAEFLVFLLNQQENSRFYGENYFLDEDGNPIKDPNNEAENLTVRNYYLKVFPARLLKKLRTSRDKLALMYSDNAFMRALAPSFNEEAGTVSLTIESVVGLQRYEKNSIVEGWEEIADKDPELAKDLFFYCFYKLGYGFSPVTFMHLVPSKVKELLRVSDDFSYIDFLNLIQKDSLNCNVDAFCSMFLRNHLGDFKTFVLNGNIPSISEPLNELAKKENQFNVSTTDNYKDSFEVTLDLEGKDEIISYLLIGTEENVTGVSFHWAPIIKVGYPEQGPKYGAYYIASSIGEGFNVTNSPTITYKKFQPLGVRNKSLQYYNADERTDPSGLNYPILAEEDLVPIPLEEQLETLTGFRILAEGEQDQSLIMPSEGVTQEPFVIPGTDYSLSDEDGNPITFSYTQESYEANALRAKQYNIANFIIPALESNPDILPEYRGLENFKQLLFEALNKFSYSSIDRITQNIINSLDENNMLVLDEDGNITPCC